MDGRMDGRTLRLTAVNFFTWQCMHTSARVSGTHAGACPSGRLVAARTAIGVKSVARFVEAGPILHVVSTCSIQKTIDIASAAHIGCYI